MHLLSCDALGVLTSYLDIVSTHSLFLGSPRPLRCTLRHSLTHVHTGSSYDAYGGDSSYALHTRLSRITAALLWSIGYRLNGQLYFDYSSSGSSSSSSRDGGTPADLSKLTSISVLVYNDASASRAFLGHLLRALSAGSMLGLQVLVLVADAYALPRDFMRGAPPPPSPPEREVFGLLAAAAERGHLRSLRRICVSVHGEASLTLRAAPSADESGACDALLALLAEHCPLLESVDGFDGEAARLRIRWPSLASVDVRSSGSGDDYYEQDGPSAERSVGFAGDVAAFPSLRRLSIYAEGVQDLLCILEGMAACALSDPAVFSHITALYIDQSEMSARSHYQAQERWAGGDWPRGRAAAPLFPCVRALAVNHWLPNGPALMRQLPALSELSVCPGYEDPAFVALMDSWNPATSPVRSLAIARRRLCLQGGLAAVISHTAEHRSDRIYAGELGALVRSYRSEKQLVDDELGDDAATLLPPYATTAAFLRAAADRLQNLTELSLCEDFVLALARRREPLALSSLTGLARLRLSFAGGACGGVDPRDSLLPLLQVAPRGQHAAGGGCRCSLRVAPHWVAAVEQWVAERGGASRRAEGGCVVFDVVISSLGL